LLKIIKGLFSMMYKYKFAEVEAIKVSNSSLGLKKLEKWIKRNFNDLCTVIRISRNVQTYQRVHELKYEMRMTYLNRDYVYSHLVT